MGYIPASLKTQISDVVQDLLGNAQRGATVKLYLPDGSTVAPAYDDAAGATGINPTFTDSYGEVPAFYDHGQYIAEWTSKNDTHTRTIRIPPLFEDFGLVDARKFGVDMTGTIDSKAALQAGVTACAGKYTLFLPPGLIRLDSKVTFPDNFYMQGCGRLTTIRASSLHTQAIFQGNNPGTNTNVYLKSFNIDANRAEREGTGKDSIRVDDGYNIFIEDVWITNQPHSGFNMLLDVNTGWVKFCRVYNGNRDGISGGQKKNFIIMGNLLENLTDDMISCASGSDGVTIVGNIFHNEAPPVIPPQGRNIFIWNSSNITVSGNVISGGDKACVQICADGGGVTNNVTVNGNVLMNAGQTETLNPYGDGFQIRDTSSPASTSAGTVRNVRITGNTIINPRRDGVHIQSDIAGGALEQINIVSNDIYSDPGGYAWAGGASYGVWLDVPDSPIRAIRISHNGISNMDAEGIHIAGTSGNPLQDIRISRNDIYNCGSLATNAYAIYLNYVQNFRLEGNDCVDNQALKTQKGIFVDNPQGTVFVQANDTLACKTPLWTLAHMENAAYLKFHSNTGIVPFSGIATLPAGTAWTSFTVGSATYYKRTLVVPFLIGLALSNNARITATTDTPGFMVSASTITTSGFTATVWTGSDPGSSTTLNFAWQVDN